MEITQTWQKQSFNNTCRLPLYPLSEWKRLNDDVPTTTFSTSQHWHISKMYTVIIALSQEGTARQPLPGRPSPSKAKITAGHSRVMSVSRQFCVNSFFVNNSNATIFFTFFLLTWRNSGFFSMGLSLFFSVIIQYIQTTRNQRVYTYAIGLPRQAVVDKVEDGSPASCGQTATDSTVL